jgi:hypothetical protein
MQSVILLCAFILSAECHYAVCLKTPSLILLRVVMMSVVILSVVLLSVVMLSAVAPLPLTTF